MILVLNFETSNFVFLIQVNRLVGAQMEGLSPREGGRSARRTPRTDSEGEYGASSATPKKSNAVKPKFKDFVRMSEQRAHKHERDIKDVNEKIDQIHAMLAQKLGHFNAVDVYGDVRQTRKRLTIILTK